MLAVVSLEAGMTKPSRIRSRSLRPSYAGVQGVDTGDWVQVDADALPADQRTRFIRRRRAIELYLQGATDSVIRREAGMARSNVYRLIVDRCLLPHADGDLHGWRGALPFSRVGCYHQPFQGLHFKPSRARGPSRHENWQRSYRHSPWAS